MAALKSANTTVVISVVFSVEKTVENPALDPIACRLARGSKIHKPFRVPFGAAFAGSARRLRVAGFASGEASAEKATAYAWRSWRPAMHNFLSIPLGAPNLNRAPNRSTQVVMPAWGSTQLPPHILYELVATSLDLERKGSEIAAFGHNRRAPAVLGASAGSDLLANLLGHSLQDSTLQSIAKIPGVHLAAIDFEFQIDHFDSPMKRGRNARPGGN